MIKEKITKMEKTEACRILKDRACNLSGARNVAFFVDYPHPYIHGKVNDEHFEAENLLRMERKYGNVIIARIYTKLPVKKRQNMEVLKLERMRFQVVIRPISENVYEKSKDVDTLFTADAIWALYETNAGIIIIASDDSDYVPILRHVRRKGKIGIAFFCSIEGSKAMTNASTTVDLIPFVKKATYLESEGEEVTVSVED